MSTKTTKKEGRGEVKKSRRVTELDQLLVQLDRRIVAAVDPDDVKKAVKTLVNAVVKRATDEWLKTPVPTNLSPIEQSLLRELLRNYRSLRTTLERVRKLRIMMHNKSSEYLASVDKNGHVVLIANLSSRGSLPLAHGKKHKFSEEEIKAFLEAIERGEAPKTKCAICGADAHVVKLPADPFARAIGNMMEEIENAIESRAAELIAGHPVDEWGRMVYWLGPALRLRLIEIVESAWNRGIRKSAQLWKFADMHVVHFCPRCELLIEDPVVTNYRCPKCGGPTVGYAPTKYQLTVLEKRLPQTVSVYHRGSIIEMPKGDALKAVAGNPRYRADMLLIVNQFFVNYARKPSVYTALLFDKMLGYADKAKIAVDRAKAKAIEARGTGILFKKVWAQVGRMALDHAFTVYLISRDQWKGPAPIHGRLGYDYIPPLVDEPPDIALENEVMKKVAKEIEAATGKDIVKVWEYWQERRAKVILTYNDILKKLGG